MELEGKAPRGVPGDALHPTRCSTAVVGGLHVVRNGLAMKDIFIESQHKGTFLGAERDGSVLANRSRALLVNKEAWTLEIFKVNERTEMELRASRELFTTDKAGGDPSLAPTVRPLSPRDSPLAPPPADSPMSPATSHMGASSDFLPFISGENEKEDLDAMYYFGIKSHLGRYLGVKQRPPYAPPPNPPPPPQWSTSSPSLFAPPPPPQPSLRHASSYTSSQQPQPSSTSTHTCASRQQQQQHRLSPLIVDASIVEPNFDCLWVIYKIRRGVWGLKSQRGDGPWLCVEDDSGELTLLDDPLPVGARFFWGFTTVRKRIKLQGCHHRYLSAELNRSVTANRERAGPWETWIVERHHSNNKWTLLSYHGYYVSGLNDGSVVANQGVAREAEYWDLVPIRKGVYGLKSLYSRYLCITPEKDGRVLSQAQSGLKSKRLDEWVLQKDHHLRRITKTLIPLSSVADIPLPLASTTGPATTPGSTTGSGIAGKKSRRVSGPSSSSDPSSSSASSASSSVLSTKKRP